MNDLEECIQLAAFGVAVIVILAVFAAFAWHWVQGYRGQNPWRSEMVRKHYAAIVSLPAAAGAAFVVVTFFRQVAGPIEIKVIGFELQGAGGPVVLWIACFLAIAFAIRICWNLGV
jgi:hypothetical protein